MQLAHPQVAQGVAEHSAFSRDPIARLLRTLRLTLALVYGDADESARALEAINNVHQRVSGPGYRATDPALLLWVHATLIDTTLEMHRLLVRPLTESEAKAYYADMRRVGEALGIPRDAFPQSVPAFHSYGAQTLATLEVTDTARRLTREIFRPRGTLTPALFVVRAVTAGLLPPALREQYGLPWGPRRQAALNATARLSRTLHPYLPCALRRTPAFLMPQSSRRPS
jgi:uncharacterized protein (DUF2236 family)